MDECILGLIFMGLMAVGSVAWGMKALKIDIKSIGIKTNSSRIAAGVFVFGGLLSLLLWILLRDVISSMLTGGGVADSTGFLILYCFFPVLSVTLTGGIFWIAAAMNILPIAMKAAVIGGIIFYLLFLVLNYSIWPSYVFIYALIAVPFGTVLGAITGTIVGLVKSKLAS